jgi:hypothetical protein
MQQGRGGQSAAGRVTDFRKLPEDRIFSLAGSDDSP